MRLHEANYFHIKPHAIVRVIYQRARNCGLDLYEAFNSWHSDLLKIVSSWKCSIPINSKQFWGDT